MTHAGRLSVRALFAFRWKLGELLHWDVPEAGVGARVRSLRERMPTDLREASRGPDLRSVPGRENIDGPSVFTSLYQTPDEWPAEICNKTVHAVMHLGWVPDGPGRGYHPRMAVLVKPHRRFGRLYIAVILPFRRALVYPLLLRSIGRRWRLQRPHQ